MPTSASVYPFAPRSTRLLKRGQFWAIPLSEGRFGAGCVVGQHLAADKPSQRMFIAGVIRWVGDHEPTAKDINNLPLVGFAFANIKAITESGGSILGECSPFFAEAPLTAEALSLPTWGFGLPKLLAERITNVG